MGGVGWNSGCVSSVAVRWKAAAQTFHEKQKPEQDLGGESWEFPQ